MHPMFFLNVKHQNDKIRLPIDLVLNEQKYYPGAKLTDNLEIATEKYILDHNNILSHTHAAELFEGTEILGIITDKVPNQNLKQPIFIVAGRYLKLLKEIISAGEAEVSVEELGFRKKLGVLLYFMFELPQVICLVLLFLMIVKIMPLIDRNFMMRSCLKRREIKKSDLNECCSICLEIYQKDDLIGETNCKHRYHEECFKNWAKESDLCPICKNNIFGTRTSSIDSLHSMTLAINHHSGSIWA